MKLRHIIFINMIFFGLMLFSASVVYQFMTGIKPLNIFHNLSHHNVATVVTTNECSPKPALNLGDAQDGYLQKLAIYQQACHSFATDTFMIFVGMPNSMDEANQSAQRAAPILQDFAKHSVRPLVIAEPTDSAGTNLDFAKFAQGTNTPFMDVYFAKLKALGITDQQMGIWNPFPEANLPYWNNNLPQYFAPCINTYVNILRKYFPSAQTAIMLNAATYQVTDFNWKNGDYQSLLPYIKGITPGSINYAGLEGFPWVPPQGSSGPILNAAEFLQPSLASEMADFLKTKNIWLNTGTFATKYALDPMQIAQVTPEHRKQILSTINQQALILQQKGYHVAVNIFAQNKSKTSEETDWSYWTNDRPFNSLATPVLTSFINQLNAEKIDFWLFDK